MAHENYSVRSSPIQDSQSPARFMASPPQGSQPSSSNERINHFTRTQGVQHRAPRPNFLFHQFINPLCINTDHSVHVLEPINSVSTSPHHTLKPTASSCSRGQLESENVKEGRHEALTLESLHFLINLRFTERFWHLSKYSFALADLQNDYLKTMFSGDVAPYRIYQKNDPF